MGVLGFDGSWMGFDGSVVEFDGSWMGFDGSVIRWDLIGFNGIGSDLMGFNGTIGNGI